MSRFFLVEVGDDDELATLYTTRFGVWTSIKIVNGVKSLCDLQVMGVSLDDILPTPKVPKANAGGRC